MADKFKIRNAARRILWRWANTTEVLQKLERERSFFRRMSDDARCMLKAQNLSGMPRGGKQSDISDIVVQVEKTERIYQEQCERINAEIEDVLRLRNAMQAIISNLTPIQERVITYRYKDGGSWQFIALKMNYDQASVRRIETQAVDYIAKCIDVQ